MLEEDKAVKKKREIEKEKLANQPPERQGKQIFEVKELCPDPQPSHTTVRAPSALYLPP